MKVKCETNSFGFRNSRFLRLSGATKTRDRMGLAGTRSRVLAFGTVGSRVLMLSRLLISVSCLLLLTIVTRCVSL